MLTAIIVCFSLAYLMCSYRTLLFYQLSGYRLRELLTAIKRTRLNCLIPVIIGLLPSTAALLKPELALLCLPTSIVVFALSVNLSTVKLKLTPRALRFIAVTALLSPLTIIGFLLAHALTSPIESKRNARFAARKTRALRENNKLIRIAITGSYGKTTTKNILAAVLSTKYNVACTKENYNTPMGLALSSDVDQNVQVFIAEFGARHVGDVEELCSLFRPTIGVITAIGSQHLETFKTQAAIRREKLALARFTSNNGGVTVCDTDYGEKNCRVVDSECTIENVTLSEKGTTFKLSLNGQSTDVTTSLLGKHIPSVIAECALTASLLGIDLETVKIAAKALKPVAHRLELLYNGKDVIIDDAYNANEKGAINAIELLPLFKDKTRVVVTPGIVEAGNRQNAINKNLGSAVGLNCHAAIFIGRNASALSSGVTNSNCRVTVVKTRDGAVKELERIKGERVVLFLNDLPDNY